MGLLQNGQKAAHHRKHKMEAHCQVIPAQGTVEKAQTVSLRGVLGADVGWGTRRSNLDLHSPRCGRADCLVVIASLHLHSP